MMRHDATLMRMETVTTRQLAGAIIRDERARANLTRHKAADAWGIGPATLGRIESGDPTVSDLMFRTVEGGLGLPTRFFAYVIDGDAERIKRLPSRAQDSISGLREDLRHYVLEALEDVADPHRRAEDGRKRRA